MYFVTLDMILTSYLKMPYSVEKVPRILWRFLIRLLNLF